MGKLPEQFNGKVALMLENLTLLAIVIILLWLAILAFYFAQARQQAHIEREIEELRRELERAEAAGQEPEQT